MELIIAIVLFAGLIISWLRLPASGDTRTSEKIAAERKVENGQTMRQAA